MDTLAHGLWGGAAFGQRDKQYIWAFVLGMCPDLFSFGPFFLTRLGDIGERFAQHRSGPPDPSTIPAYVYHAYDVTHSLIVWAVVFLVVWRLRGRIFWPLAAWALHILCDIPTHSTRFFPTPYLWPLSTPFYDGTSWGNRTFMIWNYSLITLAYMTVWLYSKYRTDRSNQV